MFTSNWSLDQELCRLTECTTRDSALVQLGIISDLGEDFTIIQDQDWIRGGAESYIYRFWVLQSNERKQGYVLKACVAFSPSDSLGRIMRDWVDRRTLLSQHGISTPKLLTYGNGVFLEEWIPYELRQRLLSPLNPSARLLEDLSILAGVLSKLGFAPIAPYDDLRSRGDDVVVVDFGQDLGPPGMSGPSSSRLFDVLIETLRSWELWVTDQVIEQMHSIFTTAEGRDSS